jgi:hypothetical protein
MNISKRIIHVIAVPLALLITNGCAFTQGGYDSALLEDGMVQNGKLILLARESHGYVRDKYAGMPLSMRMAFLAEDRKDYQPIRQRLVRVEIPLNSDNLQIKNVEPIVYPTNGWSRFDRFYCLAATNLIVWSGTGDLRDAKPTKQQLGIVDTEGRIHSQFSFEDKRYLGLSVDHSRIAAINGKLSDLSVFQVEGYSMREIEKCSGLPRQATEYSVVAPDSKGHAAVVYGITTNISWFDYSTCVTRPILHSITSNLGNVRVYLSNGNLQYFAASEGYGSPSILTVSDSNGQADHQIRLPEKLPSNWYWSDDGKVIVGLELKWEARTVRDLVTKVLIWDMEKGTLRRLML